ncbi:hypothetical protein CCR75_006012 [Bremia lactucae]|uniref:Uncharacterized protein n=1 Tax=Bremia lactucae TaxID=4779 RepID=A0A976FJ77_BRELC|nr:hypothetical protein CCR75_006012 [Bremia lactucae]
MDLEPALRRSKREHQPSAKAAASSASVYNCPASPRSSRRSQRRRISSMSPVSTIVPTCHSSPMLNVPMSADVTSVDLSAIDTKNQRQRERKAAHTDTYSSISQEIRLNDIDGSNDCGKVLGRYSSHECALLCKTILNHLEMQTLEPTVLEKAKSPAFIDWKSVASTMMAAHNLQLKPQECQLLWKCLAYGKIPVVRNDEMLLDSDDEDFCKTPAMINAEVVSRRNIAASKQDQGDASAVSSDMQRELLDGEIDAKYVKKSEASEKHVENKFDLKMDAQNASLRLYPTYLLPTGTPDSWHRPFGPKNAMPLTFVASRFLRRKLSVPAKPNDNSSATPE